MINTNMTQLMAEIQSMSQQAQGLQQSQPTSEVTNKFGKLLSDSINNVSDTQLKAGQMAEAFELGSKDVDIAEVMVNLQKANVSFQAMTQVRNRLVSAYQEIMNMQI